MCRLRSELKPIQLKPFISYLTSMLVSVKFCGFGDFSCHVSEIVFLERSIASISPFREFLYPRGDHKNRAGGLLRSKNAKPTKFHAQEHAQNTVCAWFYPNLSEIGSKATHPSLTFFRTRKLRSSAQKWQHRITDLVDRAAP